MTARRAMADALTFVLPVDCAGCGLADAVLCDPCRAGLQPRVRSRRLHDGTPVFSGLAFEGPVARVVRALKEDGRTSLARSLAPALATAAARLCAGDPGGPEPLVVPVPASRAAFRRRGYRVTELLARRAGLHPVRVLTSSRRVADQRTLGRDERRHNVRASMVARRGVAGRSVLVVDDVVTTGATLEEAVRALRGAGARVIGAATAAATPMRGPGRTFL